MQFDITTVDKNFKQADMEACKNLDFYNVDEKPFRLYGIFKENGLYRRMPQAVAESVSRGIRILHSMPTGGRVKFKTDSSTVAVLGYVDVYHVRTMPLSASAGFDVYEDNKYAFNVLAEVDEKEKVFGYRTFKTEKKMREITIYFPIYSEVKQVYVGLEKDCQILETEGYSEEKPIVYFGGSITQGCCASKCSCQYEAFIERWTNKNFLNLGFSGNGLGQKGVVDYIASLDMSAYVINIDGNVPSPEELEKVHPYCYEAVRNTHPDIPILMTTKARWCGDADIPDRERVIEKTLNTAIKNGDKNVKILYGNGIYGTTKDANLCTVDMVHPSDLGFYRVAKKFYEKFCEFDGFIKNPIDVDKF